MDAPVLNDKNIYPDDAVLSKHLGNKKAVFDSLIGFIHETYPSFTIEWRYYNDGKSWLCKIMQKKKTICWISVWDNCFRVTFYFAARLEKEVCALKIDNKIKKEFKGSKNYGKIKGLTFIVKARKQLEDIKKAINFKEKLR